MKGKDPYIELTAAAQRLHLGYFTVRDLMLRGVLRAKKERGRWLLLTADVERLARERAQTASANVQKSVG